MSSHYLGARDAGLEAKLVRGQGECSDGAARQVEEDLSDVDVISSLSNIVAEVRRRNARYLACRRTGHSRCRKVFVDERERIDTVDRRWGGGSCGAATQAEENLYDVDVISSLSDVVAEVRRRNNPQQT